MSSESEFDFLENISSSDDYKPSISDSDSDNPKKNTPTTRKRNTRATLIKKKTTSRKPTKRKKPEPESTPLPNLGKLVQVNVKDKSSTIQLESAFQLIDKEQKGFVSIEDLKRASKDIGETISEEELQEMIEVADSSNSGHVTMEDFLNFMHEDTTSER